MRRIAHRAGMVGLAASAMLACKNSNTTTDSAAAQGPAAAMGDSGTIGHDSLGGAAPPPGTPSRAPSALDDAAILGQELGGDSAEVAIATYMLASTTNAAVKAYARLLAHDHGAGMSEARAVAKRVALTPQAPPTDTSARETAHTLDHLKSLSGHDRDTAFVNHEVQDHQSDISDAKQAEQAAENPRVKALLRATLPELRMHLDRARALQSRLAGERSANNASAKP